MKKKTTLKKPTLSATDAIKFAEAPQKPVEGHQKAKASEGIASTEKSPPEATKEPKFRLTMNIRKEVHLRLKIAAAKQGTNMTELIEKLVTEHLDD